MFMNKKCLRSQSLIAFDGVYHNAVRKALAQHALNSLDQSPFSWYLMCFNCTLSNL